MLSGVNHLTDKDKSYFSLLIKLFPANVPAKGFVVF